VTSLIGLLFFFSGAIGLGYEIVWIKILSLHFGNSAWSISAVVAAFMAGLGLGSWQAGRAARNLRSPLRASASRNLIKGSNTFPPHTFKEIMRIMAVIKK
jgi:spermidine synthase